MNQTRSALRREMIYVKLSACLIVSLLVGSASAIFANAVAHIDHSLALFEASDCPCINAFLERSDMLVTETITPIAMPALSIRLYINT